MTTTLGTSERPSPGSFGQMLRELRVIRRMSQLDLAVEAESSSRHLSFLETGRSQPSREMVLRLAQALELPLRDRNVLLHAGGYAPVYAESSLDGPELEQVNLAIEWILNSQEPYPAWALDRLWNVIKANRAAFRLFRALLGENRWKELSTGEPLNAIKMTLSPVGLRPYLRNWQALAHDLLVRLRRELNGMPRDRDVRALLEEVRAMPGIPGSWLQPDLETRALPVIPVELGNGDLELTLICTTTTFGRPQDVALQELWIESTFPADQRTDEILHRLAEDA